MKGEIWIVLTGITTGMVSYGLFLDIIIACSVAFLTGAAAFYGGLMAKKIHNWRKSKKNANTQ